MNSFASQSHFTHEKHFAMKKLVMSLVMCMVLPFTLAAQKTIQSYLSYTTYCVPGDKPFIENALAFDCSTVVYNQFEPGKFKATVEIQTIFKQGDKICNYSKIALDSPVVTDTTKIVCSTLKGICWGLLTSLMAISIIYSPLSSEKRCSSTKAPPILVVSVTTGLSSAILE